MADELTTTIEQIKSEEDFFHKARLLEHLVHKKDIPLKTVSERVGMKPSYVCHIMRLNRLPEITIDGYYSKLVSISHLFIIARLKTQEQMMNVYEEVLSGSLTAVQTEERVRELLFDIKAAGTHISKDDLQILALDAMKKYPRTSIKILQSRVKSSIMIEVKGNLETTSATIRRLMKQLTDLHEEES